MFYNVICFIPPFHPFSQLLPVARRSTNRGESFSCWPSIVFVDLVVCVVTSPWPSEEPLSCVLGTQSALVFESVDYYIHHLEQKYK